MGHMNKAGKILEHQCSFFLYISQWYAQNCKPLHIWVAKLCSLLYLSLIISSNPKHLDHAHYKLNEVVTGALSVFTYGMFSAK